LENILALLHSAINQKVSIIYFQESTASCNFVGCSYKLYFHKEDLLCIYYTTIKDILQLKFNSSIYLAQLGNS